MAIRNIVKIDEAECASCGLCATTCVEGAIQIINGKAKLVSDSYCDGLGACLGHCPEGAITIEQRKAAEFDEEAVKAHLRHETTAGPSPTTSGPTTQSEHAAQPFVCPGLTRIVREAIARSGKPIDFRDVTIALRGEVIRNELTRPERAGRTETANCA